MENSKQAYVDQDRDVIDISAEHECTFWTAKFGVTYEELKNAVARVGPRVSNVRSLLSKSSQERRPDADASGRLV